MRDSLTTDDLDAFHGEIVVISKLCKVDCSDV